MTIAQKLLKQYPFPHPQVMNGELAFCFVDTYGIPLEMVIAEAQLSGLFIDWLAFLKTALASGWGSSKIKACRELANSYYTKKWVEQTYINGGK